MAAGPLSMRDPAAAAAGPSEYVFVLQLSEMFPSPFSDARMAELMPFFLPATWHRWLLARPRPLSLSLLISGRGLFRCSVPICPPLSLPASQNDRPPLTDPQWPNVSRKSSEPYFPFLDVHILP